jgi:hypothetical protein
LDIIRELADIQLGVNSVLVNMLPGCTSVQPASLLRNVPIPCSGVLTVRVLTKLLISGVRFIGT